MLGRWYPGPVAVLLAPEIDVEPRIRPLLRKEFDFLVGEGFFEGERIELLCGALIQMSPQKPLHAAAIERLTELFVPLALGRASVRIQLPFAATVDSEPEPDFALVPKRSHAVEHPAEAFLVIEVSLTTPEKDLGIKAALYAAAGVTEYWVLDLPKSSIHVHRKPSSSGYGEVRVVRPGERLTLVAFPDLEIEVDALVGRE